jgi:hypothetical protein
MRRYLKSIGCCDDDKKLLPFSAAQRISIFTSVAVPMLHAHLLSQGSGQRHGCIFSTLEAGFKSFVKCVHVVKCCYTGARTRPFNPINAARNFNFLRISGCRIRFAKIDSPRKYKTRCALFGGWLGVSDSAPTEDSLGVDSHFIHRKIAIAFRRFGKSGAYMFD